MLVDGKAIAARIFKEIENEVSHLGVAPHFTVFTCAPNLETQTYLRLKRRKAAEVGIGTNIIELPQTLTTEEVVQSVQHALMQTDGVIVQLPLPEHIDAGAVLAAIPEQYDIDGMHYDGKSEQVLPPVVGAMAAIAAYHDVLLAGQHVVVVGYGRLVGKPAADWARGQGARVTVVTKETAGNEAAIAAADVLILGAGQPQFVTPDMVKDGVIIFDAGTSESNGQLQGDAHPDCAGKAALLTPVPGGIGPITVALLLQNLLVKLSHQ